jgi:hypothetical protein
MDAKNSADAASAASAASEVYISHWQRPTELIKMPLSAIYRSSKWQAALDLDSTIVNNRNNPITCAMGAYSGFAIVMQYLAGHAPSAAPKNLSIHDIEKTPPNMQFIIQELSIRLHIVDKWIYVESFLNLSLNLGITELYHQACMILGRFWADVPAEQNEEWHDWYYAKAGNHHINPYMLNKESDLVNLPSSSIWASWANWQNRDLGPKG